MVSMWSIVALHLLAHLSSASRPAFARTSCGTVRGNQLPNGADEFLGIPFGYAERFEAPQLREAPYPQQPFDATYFGPACLQTLTSNTTYGKEDCLVMNVWKPSNATNASSLPVLVYIYGGSNDFGEAEPYNASQMAVAQNSIIASFNYRVGPLAFLPFKEQLAENKSSGNFALLDMQLALKWVRKEIHHFGGNEATVGIFGQSSGAGNVELLTVIPSSNGLFQAAISQSGGLSAMSLEDALNTTRKIGEKLNCTQRGYKSLLRCMKETNGDQVVIAQAANCITPNYCIGLSFGAVIDGILIPESPKKMLEEGRVNDVHIMYGMNTNDSYLFTRQSYQSLDRKSYIKLVRSMFKSSERATAAKRALEMYPPLDDPEDNTPVLGWLQSDKELCATKRLVRMYARAGKGRVFLYRYNYWFQSNETCTAVANYHDSELGSVHQDEVTFVFGKPIYMNIGYSNCSEPGWAGYSPSCLGCHFNKKEAAFALTMGRFWTNMGATGNPNCRTKSSFVSDSDSDSGGGGDDDVSCYGGEGFAWPVFEEGSEMNIILEPKRAPYTPESMLTESCMGRQEACEFWDSHV